MEKFIAVEDARDRIFSKIEPVGTERSFVSAAAGRHIAESVTAPEDSPRFDNSSRDGFAVRWDDIEDGDARLRVVETSAAGHTPRKSLDTGEAARIMTGAEVPEGADTVVMQENCTLEGDDLHVPTPPDPGRGAWIRRAGSHMAEGERLLEPGDLLGPADIGMLASFRDARLDLYRRPNVAVVSTGDELVDIDTTPGDGEIVNSNAYLLEALVEDAGGDPVVLPTAPDDFDATRERFREAASTADLVLSSGGVSVGAHDEVREVVDSLTGGMEFWKIRMKPGKPLAFGTTSGEGVPVLGLPGNPNSCFVGFHQFVSPALRVLQGADPAEYTMPRRTRATIDADISSTPHRRHYLAGRLEPTADGRPTFVPAPRQSSGNVGLFSGENAFGIVPEDVSKLSEGDELDVEPLSALW